MTVKSPTISTLNSLAFAGSLDKYDFEHLEHQIEELDSDGTDDVIIGCRRPSIYVEAFEGAYPSRQIINR